ncbi:unnamed protein product [Vitrella brassicaformis CCMP3155]|uniref:UBX domain-containing protein n=1 Tax=Vitrella brassicaformis (strain CCMP3155) TaxID=1169540 RepID=A0A0G4FFY5_VITBC|nr:unnamed protein product [Vitrella brassicaformis CCMP3155]|eukprot:CEM12143.1 unnamed protein product [Vitrella brassicaformis CCMP3155]
MTDAPTEQQEDILLRFQDITHAERSHSIRLLDSCSWDLEQAVSLHLANAEIERQETAPLMAGHHNNHNHNHNNTNSSSGANPSGPVASSVSSTGPLLQPLLTASDRPPASSVSAPPPGARHDDDAVSTRSSVSSWLFSLVHRAFDTVVSVGGSVLSFVSLFIFGPPSTSFPQMFRKKYGNGPRFLPGSFGAAVADAKRQLKLLVVYLHSDDAAPTASFCREVLGDEFVRSMLDEHFLVWGDELRHREGDRVARLLRCRRYPHMSIVLPASLDELRQIAIMEGEINRDNVVANLTQCLEHMEQHREEIRRRQAQHEHDRLLRAQQDAEYEESLRLDAERDKERQKQRQIEMEREAKLRAAQEAAIERARVREEERQAIKREREAKADAFRKEDASFAANPPPKATLTKIALRLPSGVRVERDFLRSATVTTLYEWAGALPALTAERKGGAVDVPVRFILGSSFPSRQLEAAGTQTLEEMGLCPNAMVLLTQLDDQDSDEEELVDAEEGGQTAPVAVV